MARMKQHQLRHHHVLRAACLLLLVSITGIAAFKLPYSHSNFVQNHMQGRKGRVFMNQASDDCDRRSLLSAGAVLSSFFALSLSSTPPARASVAFDPDRYGDKELKIATVNKLKQKLRNAIAGDLSLAVSFVRLAINDGIGYDAATNEGGPDGSIAFEMDRDQNAGLKPALETLLKVKREIQSTNEVTFGDVCAFAGAVAIESTGGPRIPVQLGR
ncbi:l-ascorbate peroxidase [Nannochloropsis gaditana]|uniref:L-ascorbate peroxidase n=1 Tax=Nannochloropsis gaditana TaxID=72520 RepID=W7U1L4_9STRA|nr:l-ascorbate peroxidase [Nannochloropsis gaditana]